MRTSRRGLFRAGSAIVAAGAATKLGSAVAAPGVATKLDSRARIARHPRKRASSVRLPQPIRRRNASVRHERRVQAVPSNLHIGQQLIARQVFEGKQGLIFTVCGRRFGKTFGAAHICKHAMLYHGWRVLYAAPSLDQADEFWSEVQRALEPQIDMGLLALNKQRRIITPTARINLPKTARIRSTHGQKPDMLRGGWADLIVLDEYQKQSDRIFEDVIQPMRLDNAGKVLFLLTAPNVLQEQRTTWNPLHARDLILKFQGKVPKGVPERDAVFFNMPSHINPHLKKHVLKDIRRQMSRISYRQEILAEVMPDVPGALWKREMFRHAPAPKTLARVVVAVDPAFGGRSKVGIVVVGIDYQKRLYAIADYTMSSNEPSRWTRKVARAFEDHQANTVVVEGNHGGNVVKALLKTHDINLPVKIVFARREKEIRADPVVGLYEQGRVFHADGLEALEDQQCSFLPGKRNKTDRLDALVWGCTELALRKTGSFFLYKPGGRMFDETAYSVAA